MQHSVIRADVVDYSGKHTYAGFVVTVSKKKVDKKFGLGAKLGGTEVPASEDCPPRTPAGSRDIREMCGDGDGYRVNVFSSTLRTPDKNAAESSKAELSHAEDSLRSDWASPPRTPRYNESVSADRNDVDFFAAAPQDTGGSLLMPDVDESDLARGIKSVVRFKCYTLQNYDMTPLNHAEFHGLRAFFSVPYEPRRGNNRPRNEQTIAKSRERICGYLGWLKQSGRFSKPSFVQFEDINLFLDKYVEGYLRAIRGLSHGSIANHITAAVDVLKYRNAENSGTTSAKPKSNMKIARLMRTRNQEQTLAERQRNDTRQDNTSSGIVWEQILEAVRRQRLVVKKLWDISAGGKDLTYELAAEVQHYVALAFYTCLPPGRSKEIRLIFGRILTESESQESLHNHIAMLQGRNVLIVCDYKNKQRWGRDTVELPADKEVLLDHLLWLMTPAVRQRLTRGDNHGFLFCKRNGACFAHASEWTAYLSGIVAKHTGVSGVSTNAMRHAFTTFMETSADEDHQRLRESVGRAMRHTGRIQQNVYNDISSIERKRKGVEFATQAFKKAVIMDVECDDIGTMPVLITPPIGAIVGFTDEREGPAFGKVLRIALRDVLVMVLRHASEASDVLTPDATKVLRKSVTELAWPIDYEAVGPDYLIRTSVAAMGDLLDER
ncbi:hypothetical protein HDU88_007994 [Geranomyces variabilis]|nr:hypothetical protein HDU88_007994 [Geranomyces variabilis]